MILLRTLTLVTLVGIAGRAYAESQFRIGYELALKVDGEYSKIRHVSDLSFSRALKERMGDYEVVVNLREVTNDVYTIIVSVEKIGEFGGIVLEDSFSSILSAPFDFSSKNELVSIEGAVSVGQIK